MAFNAQSEVKDFTKNRFMFCLSIIDKNSTLENVNGEKVNEFIVCKRYFNTFNYIEGSMQTFKFKEVVDSICDEIIAELAMESRIYITYNCNFSTPLSFGRTFSDGVIGGKPVPEELKENGGFYDINDVNDDDLVKEIPARWDYTLKFSVYDNEKEGDNKLVIERIFDAGVFPKEIRDNIDLTKPSYKMDTERLSGTQLIKAIINNSKDDLIYSILNKIYSTCSPNTKDGSYASDSERIHKILNEKYLGKTSGGKNIYYAKKDEAMAKKAAKAASTEDK